MFCSNRKKKIENIEIMNNGYLNDRFTRTVEVSSSDPLFIELHITDSQWHHDF